MIQFSFCSARFLKFMSIFPHASTFSGFIVAERAEAVNGNPKLPFAIPFLGCYDKHQKHDWEIHQKYNIKIQYKV